MRAAGMPASAKLWLVIGLMFVVALFAASPVWTAAPALASAQHRVADHHHTSAQHRVADHTPAHHTPAHHHVADHHITADGQLDHLAAVDHQHIGAATSQVAPDSFGDVMASRVRAALIAVGVVFAVALLWLSSTRHTPSVSRDPPRTPVAVLTGQGILARLCIARR